MRNPGSVLFLLFPALVDCGAQPSLFENLLGQETEAAPPSLNLPNFRETFGEADRSAAVPDYSETVRAALIAIDRQVAAGELKRAGDALGRLTAERPTDPFLLEKQARLALLTGDLPAARNALAGLREQDPDAVAPLRLLGRVELMRGQRATGLNLLKQARDADPDGIATRFWHTVARLANDQALPATPMGLLTLREQRYLIRLLDHEQADLLKILPRRVYLDLIRLAANGGQRPDDEELEVPPELLVLGAGGEQPIIPLKIVTTRELADLRRRLRRQSTALFDLDRAVQTGEPTALREHWNTVRGLGLRGCAIDLTGAGVLERAGKSSEADALIARLLRDHPRNASLTYWLGLHYLRAGNHKLSLRHLQHATTLRPRPESTFALSCCLELLGQSQSADATLAPLKSAFPRSVAQWLDSGFPGAKELQQRQ